MKTLFHFKTVVLALIAGAFLLGGCAQPYTFRGTVIEPPNPAPDFTLLGADGQPFQLSAKKGKVVLLFFGFTRCPDVCPTTMADVASARTQLGDDAKNTEVVFVTVDPERDTPAATDAYVKRYDPGFVGLSGTPEQIEPVKKAFGVTAIKRDLPNSKFGYTVDHSAFLYLIDKQGAWRAIMPFGVSADDIASDTRYLVRNS